MHALDAPIAHGRSPCIALVEAVGGQGRVRVSHVVGDIEAEPLGWIEPCHRLVGVELDLRNDQTVECVRKDIELDRVLTKRDAVAGLRHPPLAGQRPCFVEDRLVNRPLQLGPDRTTAGLDRECAALWPRVADANGDASVDGEVPLAQLDSLTKRSADISRIGLAVNEILTLSFNRLARIGNVGQTSIGCRACLRGAVD